MELALYIAFKIYSTGSVIGYNEHEYSHMKHLRAFKYFHDESVFANNAIHHPKQT